MAASLALVDTPMLVRARLTLSAQTLGLGAPPAPVKLRLVHLGGSWRIYAHHAEHAGDASAGWLAAQARGAVTRPAAGLLRLDVEGEAPPWVLALGQREIHAVDVGPDQVLSVNAEGTRAQVEHLASALAAKCESVHPLAATDPQAPHAMVTAKQFETLLLALDLGYFAVPRTVSLRSLAHRLHVSAATVSLRLRRAEGSVMAGFIESYELPAHEGDGEDEASTASTGLARVKRGA